MTEPAEGPPLELSVVVPAFNSAMWLPSTIEALADAVRASAVRAELIVVDDGSSDGTGDIAEALADEFPGTLRVIRQDNRGRFAARLSGLTVASADTVLLLDSRVLIAPDALHFVLRGHGDAFPGRAWNAHVDTDSRAPLVGRFWDVPTALFWGDYLRRPRPYVLTSENFDRAPKGTTMFLAPRTLLLDAFAAADHVPEAKLVSDDTKILRWIAERTGIRIDPGFRATYRPRTTVRAFIRHSADRGTMFVDSYGGTTPARRAILVALGCIPIVGVATLIGLVAAGRGAASAALTVAALGAAASPAALAARRGASGRGIVAYLLYLPVFTLPFWVGLCRGLVIHRRALWPRADHAPENVGSSPS